MQIVIDIPEEDYIKICDEPCTKLGLAVSDGTPLPEGHGDLVDYEELKNNAREYGAFLETTLSHIKPKIIIIADKAESEEQA